MRIHWGYQLAVKPLEFKKSKTYSSELGNSNRKFLTANVGLHEFYEILDSHNIGIWFKSWNQKYEPENLKGKLGSWVWLKYFQYILLGLVFWIKLK